MDLEDILRQHGFDTSSLILPDYQRAGEDHFIYLFRVPATRALTQWEALRNLVSETGYWPVVGWDSFKQPPWEEEPVQNILEEGLRVNIQKWLEQEGYTTIARETLETSIVEQPPFAFRLHLRRFHSTVPPLAPIALVPTPRCWEIPAYLSAQANEWDPPDAIHVAIMKYWYERWKAELVSMITGVVEMRVLQPPTTFDDAYTLAKEQYKYCPDLVDQEVGSINALARKLLNSPVWRFWWD